MKSKSLEIGVRNSDTSSTSFKLGVNGFDIYGGFSNNNELPSDSLASQYTNINVNYIIPVLVVVAAPALEPIFASVPLLGLAF